MILFKIKFTIKFSLSIYIYIYISKSFEVPKNDQRLVKMLIGFKFSNGILLLKKKTSDGVTRFQS